MNLDKLKGHIPDGVIAQIPGVMEKFEINTPLRLAQDRKSTRLNSSHT